MTTDSPTAPVAYTVRSFLKAFDIGRTKFYDEINAGRLKARKRGKSTVILAEDARAWVQSFPELEPREVRNARTS